MSQHAPLFNAEPVLGVGRIQTLQGDQYLVAGPMGMVKARRALSCLLEPRTHDTVMLALTLRTSYILHVLERPDPDTGEVVLPAHATVRTTPCAPTEKGREDAQASASSLRFMAHKVSVVAEENLDLQAATLCADAHCLSLQSHSMTLTGNTLLQRFSTIHSVATHMFQHIHRLIGLYTKRVLRVREASETRAGRVLLSADEGLRIQANHADITTKDNLNLDGKHINLG